MKISEKLEWDYSENKTGNEELEFITRDRIKEFVAAELFIPIVKELYDKNIFTNWSGLTGDAHIRIPLDGLSKENFKIAQKNCIENENWRIQRPPYLGKGEQDITPNYSIEIYIDYEDGITDVSEVVDKMKKEIRKFKYQDVQIAKNEWAKSSSLPRLTLDGLYKLSEYEFFSTAKGKYEISQAESLEELSEMYLEGEHPQYYYDEETDTYFRNKELIEKSKEYRKYEVSPEKRRERAIKEISERLNATMSDEEKYKVIFDWMTENLKYDYAILYSTQATNLAANISSKYGKIIRQCRNEINNFAELSDIERRKELVKLLRENEQNKELVELLQKEISCREKTESFIGENTEYKYGDIFLTNYGVCQDFAREFKAFCNQLNLDCEAIDGHILSDGVEAGHAWNVVIINGTLKHIDISSAIHCIDGHDSEHEPYDYFSKTFEELKKMDGNKNRTINESCKEKIENLINNAPGWDFGDN